MTNITSLRLSNSILRLKSSSGFFPLKLSRSFSQSLLSANKQSESSSFSSFGSGPAPPRLPKEEQEIFEALQRQSTGAFSTPRKPPNINQSPNSTEPDRADANTEIEALTEKIAEKSQASSFKDEFNKVIEARGKGQELHPDIRRGAKPEFEGEVNPRTGEVGGPKNDPLRWGAAGEWTYNGRTTDF